MERSRPAAPARARAWALAAVVLAAAPARAQTVGYQGNVYSVNPQTGQLVVTDALTARNLELVVTPQTRILSSLGQPLTVADLNKGDGLGVAASGAQALSIVVNQGVLRGVVTAVDIEGGTVTVTEHGTNRSVKVPVTAQTPVRSVTDQPVALTALKSGDGVLVQYAGRGVARVILNPKPAEVTAHVKSVGADMRSLLVTEVGTNANYKVIVTPQTEVVNSQGKTLEMKDLHRGTAWGSPTTGPSPPRSSSPPPPRADEGQ
jgi:hypothetical protein